ncbi:MAG: capsular biosynthesis protein, partial [Bacteroidales bacterium]|nr:capsular biosynthesis protein [Bacteroidales bacterium]
MWPFSRKTTLCKSNLLGGAIDCHTHLLPGVDDGFRKADDSLAALARMESTGVRTVWLTPHIMEDIPNETDDLRR